eukprot:9281547-Pyramimonas_sp.AAC.1
MAIRPLTQALPRGLAEPQRGFVPSRTFGNNIVELDAVARRTSMEPGVERRCPALVSYDFGQAFPSMSQKWMIQALK